MNSVEYTDSRLKFYVTHIIGLQMNRTMGKLKRMAFMDIPWIPMWGNIGPVFLLSGRNLKLLTPVAVEVSHQKRKLYPLSLVSKHRRQMARACYSELD